ncbi:hypothetical protein KCH_69210 [Kitasatospora cheerisanensis KCTC 2395]|uniref:Uncharacterized protein n=1 Tax=Kitasatospora cheerisanensis KCTC 2395 TaxID=1348663 RepID=A0A066YN03_9ACTN|nr:hypothetical protein KCH_69210 [Kitasatospora cheerisanensis KCTC 2395]
MRSARSGVSGSTGRAGVTESGFRLVGAAGSELRESGFPMA